MGDPSLVSVVLPDHNQRLFRIDLRLQVRRDTQKSVRVRGDCYSVSYSAAWDFDASPPTVSKVLAAAQASLSSLNWPWRKWYSSAPTWMVEGVDDVDDRDDGPDQRDEEDLGSADRVGACHHGCVE